MSYIRLFGDIGTATPHPPSGIMPPLVMFFNDRDPEGGGGLGVMIARNWAITCEHVVAKPTHSCDLLNDASHDRLSIEGVVPENSTIFLEPEHLGALGGRNGDKSPLDEKLVLVKVGGRRAISGIPDFSSSADGSMTLWTATGARTGPPGNCMISKVDLGTMRARAGHNVLSSRVFNQVGKHVKIGDSGGGIFAAPGRGEATLVAIQNAMRVYDGSEQGYAIGLPLSRCSDWIWETINS